MTDFYIFLLIMICYAGYAWSLVGFCKQYLECTKGKAWLFGLLIFVGCISLTVAGDVWNISYILIVFIRYIAFFAMVLLLFRGDVEKKLLITAIILTLKELVWNFSNSLLSCFLILVWKAMKWNMDMIFELWMGKWIGCLGLGVLILVIRLLAGRFVSVFRDKVTKWYVTLAVPLLAIIAVMVIVNMGVSNGILVVSGVIGAEYGRVWLNALFSNLAICLLSALLMCMAAGCIFGMDKINREQRKKEQYREQVEFYRMLEEQYSQMERLRHDMKNHVIGLQGLWENQEWEKMGHYLAHMLETGNIGKNEEVTGNKAVDALLYRKRKQAEENHITWECDMQLPGTCNIEEFDMCVLLGNILDNAIEACDRLEKEDRFISIQSGMVKRCLLLEVKNSTDVQDIKRIGRTTKVHPEEHGIGFLNIYETVQKYNGIVNVEIINRVFVISVLLPVCDTVYNNKSTI